MESTIDISIRRAAEILKAEGAQEIYLFGSEAAGTAGKGSDVDFAVAGLPPASSITLSVYSPVSSAVPWTSWTWMNRRLSPSI